MNVEGIIQRSKKLISPWLFVILIIAEIAGSMVVVTQGWFLPASPDRVVQSQNKITFENTSYDVSVNFLDYGGELYAGISYKCNIRIEPIIDTGNAPDTTFRMKLNNAAWGENSSHLLPEFFDVPGSRTLWVMFQSSGESQITVEATSQTNTSTFILPQIVGVEPWSSYYQIHIAEFSTLTNILSVGLAMLGVVLTFSQVWKEKKNPKDQKVIEGKESQ
jgi:hypothetical protein